MMEGLKQSLRSTARSGVAGDRSGADGELAALLLAASTVAFLVPALFALRYPHELVLNVVAVMGLSVALFVGFAGALWLVWKTLRARGGSAIGGRFARFCLAWALLTGFVSPLIRGGGMVEVHAMTFHGFNAAFSLVLSLVFAWLPYSSGARLFVAASAMAPLVLFGGVVRSAICRDVAFQGVARLGTLSAQDNMIVLSLDGIPGHLVRELIETRDPLIDEFRDFTWFEDAVSTSPATSASMLSELFGNRDFRSLAPTESSIRSKLDWSTLFFNGSGDDVLLYGPHGYAEASPERHVKLAQGSASVSTFFSTVSFLNIAVARTGSHRSARLVRNLALWLDAELGRDAVYRGPAWKEPFLGDREVLDAVILSLRVGEAKRSIRIMHFLHTHFPPDFDERGVLRAVEPGWQEKNRDPAAMLEQTRFALSQVARFLQELRRLGIYDRSLVVIKSDHGEPPEFFDAAPWNLKIRGNPLWGYCRYRPLLMLKGRDSRAPQLKIDQRLVTLGDLAKTLCIARAHPAKSCAAFPGLDLFSSAQPSENERWIFIEVVKNARSGFLFDQHETVRFDRTMDFLDQFYEKGLIPREKAIK